MTRHTMLCPKCSNIVGDCDDDRKFFPASADRIVTFVRHANGLATFTLRCDCGKEWEWVGQAPEEQT